MTSQRRSWNLEGEELYVEGDAVARYDVKNAYAESKIGLITKGWL